VSVTEFDLVGVAATVASLTVARVRRAWSRADVAASTSTMPPDEASAGRAGEPGLWAAGIVALLCVNQILFTVYVLRVHHGDPGFVARSLPSGWFRMATHQPILDALARAFPHPTLLSVTVLRVQAFLELPFVVTVYLTVARWLGEVYPRLLRPAVRWCACLGYTTAFMLAEAYFWNRWTRDDLVVRAVSCVVTAAVLGPLLRRRSGPPRRGPATVAELAVFLVSAAALGGLVLVVYDTFLLYNLGRVSADAPVAAGCAVLLVLARAVAGRMGERADAATPPPAPGPHVRVLMSVTAAWVALFFPCALPIRYLFGFGTPWLGPALAGAVSVAALAAGVRAAGGEKVAAGLALAAAAGAVGLIAGTRVPGPYPEIRLLAGAVLGLAAATTVLSVLDRRTRAPRADRADR